MADGFLLDAYPDPQRREMVVWLKTDQQRAVRLAEPFTPHIHARATAASGGERKLRELTDALGLLRGIGAPVLTRARCGLEEHESDVLRIPVHDYTLVQRIAQTIDARGDHKEYELFDVDLRMTHRYLLAKGLWPFVRMRAWAPGRYRLLETDRWSLDYTPPTLRAIELGAASSAAKGTLATHETPLQRAWVVDVDTANDSWQPVEGTRREFRTDERVGANANGSTSEAATLDALMREVHERDPDVVLTKGGDTFLLPYLQARAHAHDLDFWLGRERDPAQPRKRGKSYFTYGKIKYQAPAWTLHGRIHIDRASSFFYTEAGFAGLLDLARISNVPLQDVARLGAGTALTAIQIDLAASQGRLIPWKKNVPETFKTARDLLLADRGGYIFEPHVGLHESVSEFDFASLYPNIMIRHNISPETLLCSCCDPRQLPYERVVPQLGTWACDKRPGFIPTYLKPIVARREHHKRMRKLDPSRRTTHQQICDVYKWLLVTSFGYQGYKNAKFGRIENHEAISAWGREHLLHTVEIARDHGFETLHGIVDSLWLKRTVPGADPARFQQEVKDQIGIPFEHEGNYKWIVFLPARTGLTARPGEELGAPVIGALNRYYGCFDKAPEKPSRSQAGQPLDYIAGGALKVRGVEMRQHSTPRIVREVQERYLDEVARADDKQAFLERLPRAVDAARPILHRILDGACDPKELVFTASVSRDAAHYRVMTGPAAAVKQLAARGVDVPPGDTVHYIILDEASREPERKVREVRLLRGDETYDRDAYARVALRALASLTRPLGLDEPALADRLLERGQTTLGRWITAGTTMRPRA